LGDAELEDLDGTVDEVKVLPGGVGEVDQQVGALSGGEFQSFYLDWRGEQALIDADLVEGLPVSEGQGEEAAVGGVKDAEAVEARLNHEVRPYLAVKEDTGAAELGNPGVFGIARLGVEELTVGGELAVVDLKRNLVFAGRKFEGILCGVAQKGHAGEPGVHVEAVEPHGVVVIPEGGGNLLKGIGADAGLAGDEPVVGLAVVFGGGSAAVEMDAGADVGDVAAAAVEGVVNGKEVLGGETIDPFDLERLVGADVDKWGEGCVAVAPHAGGGYIAMNFGVDLAHGDAELVRMGRGDWPGALGEGKFVDKWGERVAIDRG
jgi:hypothetical protein